MTGRRSFIKNSILSLSSGILVSPASISHYFDKNTNPGESDDFWKEIRKKFPLTDERVYFNNGTIGPSPYPVIKAINDTILKLNSWGEYNGYNDSRRPVADFVHVTEDEISLTHNTTEGINIIAAGLPLKRGDEVIMTTHEHAGNALPWLNQQEQKGIVIKAFSPGKDAATTLNLISDLINPRTRVIAVPHITCTTGHVMPVKSIATLGHDKGLWVFFDGAHAPGSLDLNVGEIDCDFYASCGHKWMLGPSGTGFVYVKKELQPILNPMGIGAYSDTGWEISESRQILSGYVPTAHKYDYGTQSAALAHGLKAAVEFMDGIGMEKVEAYSSGLTDQLFNGLREIGHPVEILTPSEMSSRGTMVTFRIKDRDYKTFGQMASERKFRIRLVPESGLDAIRISTHIYNNRGQVDEFVSMVSDFVKA